MSSKRGEVESPLLVDGIVASLSMVEKARKVSAAVVECLLQRDRGDVVEAAARNRGRGGWMALFLVKTRTIDGRKAGGGVMGVWDQQARNVIRHVERCSFGMDAFWRGRVRGVGEQTTRTLVRQRSSVCRRGFDRARALWLESSSSCGKGRQQHCMVLRKAHSAIQLPNHAAR